MVDSYAASPPTSIVPIQIWQTYETSKVKEEFWYCECGSKEEAKILGIHDGWALWMVCPSLTCQRTWYVCNRCPDSRKKITNKEGLKRHNKQQHKKNGGIAGRKRKSNNTINNNLSKKGGTTTSTTEETSSQQQEGDDGYPFAS
jgi:hypothetical protein